MLFLAYSMYKVISNFYFFYFLNVLKCAIFSNKKLNHLKKNRKYEIFCQCRNHKSIKMNQYLYGQWGSDPLKPIPFVLVPEFYYEVVNKEKVVPDLHYDNLPSIGI